MTWIGEKILFVQFEETIKQQCLFITALNKEKASCCYITSWNYGYWYKRHTCILLSCGGSRSWAQCQQRLTVCLPAFSKILGPFHSTCERTHTFSGLDILHTHSLKLNCWHYISLIPLSVFIELKQYKVNVSFIILFCG